MSITIDITIIQSNIVIFVVFVVVVVVVVVVVEPHAPTHPRQRARENHVLGTTRANS